MIITVRKITGCPFLLVRVESIHSVDACLLSTCCVLGSVLGPEDTTVRENNPARLDLMFY